MKYKLQDFVIINPTEKLRKGSLAKKVPMDKLQPFCRDIPCYELTKYSGGTKFKNGDTIMARITPCLENGKTAMVSILDEGEIGFGSTEYIVFRAKEGVSNPDFVYYLVCSPAVRETAIKSMVGSSGRQRVQTDVVANIELDLPSIEIQTKIASILRSIDDKIALNNEINYNLEQQLHINFTQIFSNLDVHIPLGNVVETTSGGTPSRKNTDYYTNGDICWVKSKELLSGYISDTEEHITNFALSHSSAKMLPKYSVLIAMYGATVGAYGIISTPMACNQAVCALIANDEYPFTYLFQMAKEQQEKLMSLAVGSAQQNISQVLIKQLLLHSDLNAIKAFHEFALPLHRKIELLHMENKSLSTMRDTLLPKLMSGELDVSEVEI